MIIYQASELSSYSTVIKHIRDNINIENDEFYYPFELEDQAKYKSKNNIISAIPENLKHFRSFGLLYGIFGSNHLNRKDGDFIFTIIQNPIDNIYSIYKYWESIKNTSISSEKNEYNKNIFTLIEQNDIPTFEKYIDNIIEKKQFIFRYQDINYRLNDEIIYGFRKENFNYICKFENINRLFKILNPMLKGKITDLNIKFEKTNFNYRVKDLENLFKEEIEFYNNLE